MFGWVGKRKYISFCCGYTTKFLFSINPLYRYQTSFKPFLLPPEDHFWTPLFDTFWQTKSFFFRVGGWVWLCVYFFCVEHFPTKTFIFKGCVGGSVKSETFSLFLCTLPFVLWKEWTIVFVSQILVDPKLTRLLHLLGFAKSFGLFLSEEGMMAAEVWGGLRRCKRGKRVKLVSLPEPPTELTPRPPLS